VKEKFKFLSTTTAYLSYPPWGIGNKTITYIQALDKYKWIGGGYAGVLGGGVGHTYVTLGFRSQFNRGINFVVEIFGK
jgi:hypothetical protein